MSPSASLRWIAAALARGEAVTLEHSGHSMRPALVPGDRVTVRALRGAPRPGSLVLARFGERLVAHRLIGARAGELVLRGDANDRDDPPVSPAQLLGEVVAVEPAPAGLLARSRRRLAMWWRA